MYRAYIDESSEKDDAVFAVGGFGGHEDEWKAIEPSWIASLPAGIDYFHATDCFGGRAQFRGMSISERVRLLNALTDLIVARKLYLAAGVMDVPVYEKISPRHLENEFWGNKYAAAFGVPVEYTCQLQNDPSNPFPEPGGELCQLFIEDNEYTPSADRVLANMRNDPILWWRGRIGSLMPGKKTGPTAMPMLQLGDLGAFLTAKKVANAKDGRIPWSVYYDKLLQARRIFRIVHVDEKSINTLHLLHKDLKKEAVQGKSYWDDI
jgi:hypothetical protein